MLNFFKKFISKNEEITKVQNNISELTNPIIAKEILDGVLLTDIELTSGVPLVVNHKLGREPQGYIIVKQDAPVSLYYSAIDDKSITLNPAFVTDSITDWVSFTPTGLWTTNVNYGGSWRRVGDTLEVRTTMFFSGAVGAGDCYLNLPPGLVIDTTKLWYGNRDDQILGEGTELRSGVSRTYIKVHYRDTTSAQLRFGTTAGGFAPLIDNTPVRNNAPTTIANGDEIVVSYSVPIVGWTAPINTVTTKTLNLTDWTSFTPTGSWTTNTAYTGMWRRVGDSAEIHIRQTFSGIPDATDLTWDMPTGLVIDTTKALVGGGFSTLFGQGVVEIPAFANFWAYAEYRSTTSLYICKGTVPAGCLGHGGVITRTSPGTINTGSAINITFRVPIVGWSTYTDTTITSTLSDSVKVSLWVF